MMAMKMEPTSPAAKSSGKVRILVVDDHPLARAGVSQWINRQPDMMVCAQADTVESADAELTRQRPDLLLLDLWLGAGDTLEFIKLTRARWPQVAIVVLSQHDETLYAERALRAGARGYVMKQESSEDILNAIRTVMGGDLYLSRRMTPLLLRRLLTADTDASGTLACLSDRELHVFQLLGAGLSSRQIAEELKLSIKTVETHRENIKHKLRIPNAAELVKQASAWVLRRLEVPR
jgi:DNA-binding NarL/FixJ family response regulator